MRFVFERLDRRQLLSATTTWYADSGTLVVSGSASADEIEVHLEGNISSNGTIVVSVSDAGTETYHQSLTGLLFLIVDGGDGNDKLTVSTHSTPNTYALVNGGNGEDTIVDSAFLAQGHFIDAGAGNDNVTLGQIGSAWSVVNLGAGDDTASVGYSGTYGGNGAVVNGNDGNDTIGFTYDASGAQTQWMFANGDAGNDTITGVSGVFGFFSGGDGNDNLNGGGIMDYLAGGADNDSLTGNGGQDVLLGNAGTDTLNSANDGQVDWLVADNDDVVNADAGDLIWTA